MWRKQSVVLSCLVFMMTIAQVSVADAGEACIDKSYAKGMTIGGVVGTGLGIAGVGAAGLGTVTITVGAGLIGGTGIGVAIAVDCATTFCLGTVLTGTVLGIVAAWLWLFADDPGDCAGSIHFSRKTRNFTMNWNNDSNQEAMQDGKSYCESEYGGTCEPILLFRECAALATDYVNRIWAVGAEETASLAEKGALDQCKKIAGAKRCVIAISARCNSG